MKAELTLDEPEQIRAQHAVSPDGKPRLHVVWEAEEMGEVQLMINRAYGTMEPRDWPAWVRDLEKKVHEVQQKSS